MQNNYRYKDSGIEWLGEVPEHWGIQKIKHVATYSVSNVDKKTQDGESPILLFNYTDVYNNEYLTNDMELMAASASQGQIDNFIVHIDDVLITKDSEDWRDIAKPALVKSSAPDIVCGYHLALIRPSKLKTDGKFLFRLLQSTLINQQFQINSNGVTRYGLPKSAIGESLIILPPYVEQQSIIQYLDRETGRIDALIQKKERLIELLKEKRIALITQAVTKGFDPNVPMKDSGIEWLGDVPEHWETTKAGFGYLIQLGKMLQPEPDKPSDVLINYMKAVNVQWDVVTVDDESLMWASNSDLSKYRIQHGDLLVCEGGEAGRAAILEFEVGDMIIQNALHRVRSSDNNVRYLLYLLQVASNQGWFDILCNKATIAHFTRDKFSELRIPYPPVREQDLIVSHILDVTQSTKELVDKITTSIAILREYRSSLINAAVTGKIDLRDAL